MRGVDLAGLIVRRQWLPDGARHASSTVLPERGSVFPGPVVRPQGVGVVRLTSVCRVCIIAAYFPDANGRLWPISAVCVSIIGCRTGKFTAVTAGGFRPDADIRSSSNLYPTLVSDKMRAPTRLNVSDSRYFRSRPHYLR